VQANAAKDAGVKVRTRVTALTGDQCAAEAMRQIDPDVVAAYPISPQTEIVMNFAQFVADGRVKTEMIPVESEHSAMSACIGAAAAGARTMTATSANGLALMWEMVYIASGLRLPIVMPVVNRALSAPINIHCDHSDTMGARDAGWIQMYCEDNQEVYESIILAVKIAEHKDISLPVMVCQDGFITSHAVERVEIFEDAAVKEFIGGYTPKFSVLDVDHPITVGSIDLQDYYFEHKRQQAEAMRSACSKMPEAFAAFERAFGKRYGFIEGYRLEDAEIAVVVLSSAAGTARGVVDGLREKGVKAGLLKPRFMRPFPAAEIVKALSGKKAVAVLDRSDSFSNQGGPVCCEVKAALFGSGVAPLVANYIFGLGGRDIYTEDIGRVFADLQDAVKTKKIKESVTYLGVR